MRIVTLGTRGTDVILAALKLNQRFTRDEIIERYKYVRQERNDRLPQFWEQGISNEIQRLSSDCSRFHKEGRKLDLITRIGRGEYALRDNVRPLLVDAANEYDNLLKFSNTLMVPIEGDDDAIAASPQAYNHIVGLWAQRRIMETMDSRGFTIIEDTSIRHSYDFSFWLPNRRTSVPQVMESKGTQKSELDVSLTSNEMEILHRTPGIFWLGVVYNIEIADGRAHGGSVPYITEPPIIDRWKFISGGRLRRREQTLFAV